MKTIYLRDVKNRVWNNLLRAYGIIVTIFRTRSSARRQQSSFSEAKREGVGERERGLQAHLRL